MRLIDAEALKTIKSIQSADFNSIETIRQWIDSAPTIDTTIDIVRCKDCKYIGKVGDVNVCRIHEISTRADDYCSRGERSGYCEHAKNLSGDIWECDCFLDTYCEHQIYDRNPDGTLNIVKCGERSEE